MLTLSTWDDYFVHQTEEPIERVAGKEQHRLDSCYVAVMGVKEDVFLATGLRSYPNTRNMPAYALAWKDGIQYNFRATREIRNDRADTVVGPLSITIVQPHKQWKLKLEENEHAPISYDLELEAVTVPYLIKTTASATRFGDNFCHLAQPCRYNGRLVIAGQEYQVKDWIGPRDRFWGVLVGQEVSLHLWMMAQFEGFNVFVFHEEQADGSIRFSEGAIMTEKQNVPLAHIEHNLVFESGTRRLSSAQFGLTATDGSQLVLQVTTSEVGVSFAGAPCGGDFSRYIEPLHFEGDRWNLGDRATFASLADHLSSWTSEVKCGDQGGYCFLEYAVGQTHSRYGSAA